MCVREEGKGEEGRGFVGLEGKMEGVRAAGRGTGGRERTCQTGVGARDG